MLKSILLLMSALLLLSFGSGEQRIKFKYPKMKEAAFSIPAPKAKFKKEWRGSDYYYFCENLKQNIVCSVLFYKLNQEEVKKYIEPIGGLGNAMIALAYFTVNSPTRSMEKNSSIWGKKDDAFMFRQMDLSPPEDQSIKQKNMFAYGMFGNDLFVSVHLSKVSCTGEDSLTMRNMLTGIKKKNEQ